MKDKIGVLWALLEKADKVIVGGRMAYTFLMSQGVQVGSTHVENDWLETAAAMVKFAHERVRPLRHACCTLMHVWRAHWDT